MSIMKHYLPTKRMDKPIMIRLSADDRARLEAIAKAHQVPMATIAYCALRRVLDDVSTHGDM